ncbi:MAG: hypothetical protein AAFY20_06100 [Cyanobacteria bacterium J06639_14]
MSQLSTALPFSTKEGHLHKDLNASSHQNLWCKTVARNRLLIPPNKQPPTINGPMSEQEQSLAVFCNINDIHRDRAQPG